MTAVATSPIGLNFTRFDNGSQMIAVGTNAVHLTPDQAEALTRYVQAVKSTRWGNLIKQLRQAANPDCWTAANAIEVLEARVADKDEIITLLRGQLAGVQQTGGEAMILMTPRQKEVAKLVALGMTNKQIARELGISPHTVRAHLERVFIALGAANRSEVAWKMREAA